MLHFPLKDVGKGEYNVHPEDEICLFADAQADKEAATLEVAEMWEATLENIAKEYEKQIADLTSENTVLREYKTAEDQRKGYLFSGKVDENATLRRQSGEKDKQIATLNEDLAIEVRAEKNTLAELKSALEQITVLTADVRGWMEKGLSLGEEREKLKEQIADLTAELKSLKAVNQQRCDLWRDFCRGTGKKEVDHAA